MMLRGQAKLRRAENGEQVLDGDFRADVSAMVETLRHEVHDSEEGAYACEWVPIPDADPLEMEVSHKLSLNPVSNVLDPNELLHGNHVKATRMLDRLLQISIMRVNHIPDTKHYFHEGSEGYHVSRDEVYRLQQMSRQAPFDEVMSTVGPPEQGRLYWVVECEHGQQRVRTESRNRTEPSFSTTLDVALPRSHTEASKFGIAISLWDEKGPVGRNGFHEPVKIGTTIVYYQQILQILRSERTHMPEVLKLSPQHINEIQDDGVQRNATWLPLQVTCFSLHSQPSSHPTAAVRLPPSLPHLRCKSWPNLIV